jgi:hypothetical protein
MMRARRHQRLSPALSPGVRLGRLAVTASFFLMQNDVQRLSAGRWPLLGPWLRSSALPVFAVLSVLMAIAWRAVREWLAEYVSYAAQGVARAQHAANEPALPRWRIHPIRPPRALFGLAFESRPPPLPAQLAVTAGIRPQARPVDAYQEEVWRQISSPM